MQEKTGAAKNESNEGELLKLLNQWMRRLMEYYNKIVKIEFNNLNNKEGKTWYLIIRSSKFKKIIKIYAQLFIFMMKIKNEKTMKINW